MSKPLCIDLFCGLGGFTEGFLAEGYDCVGFDIERHAYNATRLATPDDLVYWEDLRRWLDDKDAGIVQPKPKSIVHYVQKYPAQLVLQDVLTLDGRQFKDAAVIVASPPCTEFSYRGRYGRKKNLPPPVLGVALFNACLRIGREANVPVVIENVVWAQEFVGRAVNHWGSQYLWGDVPAILPLRSHSEFRKGNSAGLASISAGSRTAKRKQMTAELSKIPLPLSQHIARVFKPTPAQSRDKGNDQRKLDAKVPLTLDLSGLPAGTITRSI